MSLGSPFGMLDYDGIITRQGWPKAMNMYELYDIESILSVLFIMKSEAIC